MMSSISIQVIAIVVFLAVFLVVVAVSLKMARSGGKVERRLRDVRSGPKGGAGQAPEDAAAGQPNLMVSVDIDSFHSLRANLTHAGYRGRNSVAWFRVTQILFAIAFGMVGFWLAGFLRDEAVLQFFTVAGAVLTGWILPKAWVMSRVNSRREDISRAIPNVLDLIIVCVEAGLSLNAAVQRIAKEMRHTYPELAKELSILNQELFLGVSRSEAFRNLALRTGVDEMRALATVLMQSDRLGTSVAQVLRVQADTIRTKRRQRAMEHAQKMSIKLLFPLVLFIFPELMVVIIGPAAIQIYRALTDVAR